MADEQNSTQPKPVVAGKALEEALQQRRGLVATGQTLRRAVLDVQDGTGVCVLLDRRIDPSTLINVATGYVTVRETIQALADAVPDTGASFGENFVMLGPKSAANRLRTLTAINRDSVVDLRRTMDSAGYRQLTELYDVSWPDLAQPRELLSEAAKRAGLDVADASIIPHDLWAATSLPQMAFADFATLVLNQFDLTFEISADGTIRCVRVPEIVQIEQRHRVAVRDKDAVTQRWEKAYPELEVTWKGTAAVVLATVEIHEQLKELIDGKSIVMVEAAGILSRRYSMNAPAGTKLGNLITSLRAQDVPVRIEGRTNEQISALLQMEVAFDLSEASAKDFFATAFGGLGAEISVTDEEVVLKFAEEQGSSVREMRNDS